MKKEKIYSVQDIQRMYTNQDTLSALECEVLNVAMWDAARRANYHGYKPFENVFVTESGEIGVFIKGARYIHKVFKFDSFGAGATTGKTSVKKVGVFCRLFRFFSFLCK